jgi:hypothetical protein
VLGAALLGLEAATDPVRALFAYTAAFAFCVSVALGALVFIQLVHAAHAVWVIPLRRLVEAPATTIPLYLVLFVPLAVGYRYLYPWAHPWLIADLESRAHAVQVARWFNPAFFVARAYLYLLVWTGVALVLRRASVKQDEGKQPKLTERQRTFSAATLPLIAFTLSFAAFDWFMPLVAGWSDDLYGIYFFVGGFFGAIGLLAVSTGIAVRSGILPHEVGPSHMSAVGRVLLTSVILWSYIAAVTLILIWIANLPRETRFFSERVRGAWVYVSWVLFLGHFLVAFLVMLLRSLKRHAVSLAAAGAWAVAMHVVDVYWLIVPSSGRSPSLLDAGALLAVGGVVTMFAVWRFKAVRPYPVGETYLGHALRYEAE